MSNYKQLTYEQRCQIEALKKCGMTQQEIADAVDTSQSTTSGELKRNKGQRGYRHKQAQRKTDQRRHGAAKAIKMDDSMIERVELKLREKWSPEQISGWLLDEQSERLSTNGSINISGKTSEQGVSCIPTSDGRGRSIKCAAMVSAAGDRSAIV